MVRYGSLIKKRLLRREPSDCSDGLSVLELAESVGVVERFHEDLRQLLLVLGVLVLLLPANNSTQQHVTSA